jgi:hypothetical protein
MMRLLKDQEKDFSEAEKDLDAWRKRTYPSFPCDKKNLAGV